MKSLRFLTLAVLLWLPMMAVAQHEEHKAQTEAPKPQTEAQKSFTQIKSLAGSWVGTLTTFPPEPDVQGKLAHFSLRVTSRGHALVHEISMAGMPDHPVTMFYLDGDRMSLTHYCDAGNRPHMVGKMSPDGKTLEFEFVDLSGGNQFGHMHHAVITFIDANHHTEDWTYMMPGDKPIRAHFDLHRTNIDSSVAGQ